MNSLINVTQFVWETMEVEPAAVEMSPQPPDALLNLRSQCDNQSKQQQLYAKKPDNWLVSVLYDLDCSRSAAADVSMPLRSQDWNQAQEARVKCAAAWARAKAGTMQHHNKLALLKEYLVLLFHTVMPPDVRA